MSMACITISNCRNCDHVCRAKVQREGYHYNYYCNLKNRLIATIDKYENDIQLPIPEWCPFYVADGLYLWREKSNESCWGRYITDKVFENVEEISHDCCKYIGDKSVAK